MCFHMCLTLCMCIRERGKKTRKIAIDCDDSVIVVVVRSFRHLISGLLPWKQISASKMVTDFATD